MTRETRIAMLVGLLFIIMFGLVISELTGHSGSTAPPKARAEQAVNQRYGSVIDILEPPPPGEAPGGAASGLTAHETSGGSAGLGSPTGGDASRAGLRVPERAADACAVAEAIVRRDTGRPAELAAGPSPATERIEPPAPTEASPPPPAPVRKYVVKPKDTLLRIARAQYGPRNERQVVLIRQANKDALKGGDTSLQVGTELVIPPLPEAVAPPATTAAGPAPSRPAPTPPYSVMDLAGLGRAFGRGSAVGPAPSPAPEVAPVPPEGRTPDAPKKYYTIRSGDNLAKIAEEQMGDDSRAAVRRLYNANKSRLRDPNKLSVGVRLEIPT